jgi:hypothetical protein
METGSFPLTLRASDASGLAATATVTLTVTPPVVGIDNLVGPFLLTQRTPTEDQLQFLDRAGNRNGFYDLGDLRAFLLANPGLPMTSADRGLVREILNIPAPGRGGDGAAPRSPSAAPRRGGGGSR